MPRQGELYLAVRGNHAQKLNKKIKTLEAEFDNVFGLYAQVCYTDANGKRYYTKVAQDDKTISSFNAECEKNGCKKGVWE